MGILVAAGCGFFLSGLMAPAAKAAMTNVDSGFLQEILQRLEKNEAETKELRNELNGRPSAAGTNTTAAAPADVQQRLEKQDSEIKDLKSMIFDAAAADSKAKYPNVSFHGFGDIGFSADSRKDMAIPYGVGYYRTNNAFYLGELDLFLRAQLAENVSVLSENAISVGPDNHTGWDIERLYLEDALNDNFIVDFGRFHTAIGYYNTTYHHGTWLQNAISRPTFLQFEDSGGILPVHMVGLSIHGAVPSGSLNMNYYLELGNGENYSTNSANNAVQQLVTVGESKAINFALTAKPEAITGVQVGGNVYWDSIKPEAALTRYDQLIFGAFAVYHSAAWEFLNEAYLIRDTAQGGSSAYSTAAYTQLSRKFGVLTPYGRFTYYRVSPNDKLYGLDNNGNAVWAGGVNVGTHCGPSLGLRYDLCNYAALKAQYDYLYDSGLKRDNRITMQASFTF